MIDHYSGDDVPLVVDFELVLTFSEITFSAITSNKIDITSKNISSGMSVKPSWRCQCNKAFLLYICHVYLSCPSTPMQILDVL